MKKKEDNIIGDKSVKFALRIVKCYQYLQEDKEETDYWLYLLSESEFLDEKIYKSFNKDIKELIKLLVSIIKTARKAQNG